MTSRKFTNALNVKLRRAIQREQIYRVYERRHVENRELRHLFSLLRAVDCVIAALAGGVAVCVLVLTGVL